MRTSIKLRQERARVVESLREATERAERENRNLDTDERETYDRYEREYVDLTERIQRAEAVEEREAEDSRSIGTADHDGRDERGRQRTDEDRQRDQRSAFARFVRQGVTALSPEQRALVEDATGEIIVPEVLETEIVRDLPALTIIRNLVDVRPISGNRVRRRSMDEVTVGWGKLETKAAGELANRESSLTPDAGQFTYVEDLYGLTKIGEDELDDTDVNLEGYIRSSFSNALAAAEDTGFTVGAGHASEQPVGLFSGNAATQITEQVSGQANVAAGLNPDDFLSLVYALDKRYRRNGRFLLASATELAIAKLKDSNGNYLWKESTRAGTPNTFHGYAIENQEDIPAWGANALVAAFGDFKTTYRIYDRQGMVVQRLNELYAEDGLVGFKVRRRVTGDVVKPEATVILKAPAT